MLPEACCKLVLMVAMDGQANGNEFVGEDADLEKAIHAFLNQLSPEG
jgi:hypothetical protein